MILSAMDDPGQEFIAQLDDDAWRALVETMVLAAYADGEFHATERARFAASLEALGKGRFRSAELGDWIAAAAQSCQGSARDACIESIKQRLPDARTRHVALVLAADIVAADGILRETERALILALAERLEIDRALAEDVLGAATADPSASWTDSLALATQPSADPTRR